MAKAIQHPSERQSAERSRPGRLALDRRQYRSLAPATAKAPATALQPDYAGRTAGQWLIPAALTDVRAAGGTGRTRTVARGSDSPIRHGREADAGRSRSDLHIHRQNGERRQYRPYRDDA